MKMQYGAIGTTGYPDEKEHTSDINFTFTPSVSSPASHNPDMVADQLLNPVEASMAPG